MKDNIDWDELIEDYAYDLAQFFFDNYDITEHYESDGEDGLVSITQREFLNKAKEFINEKLEKHKAGDSYNVTDLANFEEELLDEWSKKCEDIYSNMPIELNEKFYTENINYITEYILTSDELVFDKKTNDKRLRECIEEARTHFEDNTPKYKDNVDYMNEIINLYREKYTADGVVVEDDDFEVSSETFVEKNLNYYGKDRIEEQVYYLVEQLFVKYNPSEEPIYYEDLAKNVLNEHLKKYGWKDDTIFVEDWDAFYEELEEKFFNKAMLTNV